MVTLIAAAIPDVVLFFEQINTSPSIWYASNDLADAPPTHAYKDGPPEAVRFQMASPASTYTVLPQGYHKCPALHHNVIHKDLDCLFLPQISYWSIALITLCLLNLVSKK